MTVTPHPVSNPYTLKTATCVFEREGATSSDDFSDHIGEITLTPNTASGSWTSITGKVITENGIATWAAGFGLVQDLDDASFLRWLLAHEGEKAEVTATLKGGADSVIFTVTLSPASIGGAAGADPLSSNVTMPIDGKPEFV